VDHLHGDVDIIEMAVNVSQLAFELVNVVADTLGVLRVPGKLRLGDGLDLASLGRLGHEGD